MITANYDAGRDTLVCAFTGKQDSEASAQAAGRFQEAWTAAQAQRQARPGVPAVEFDLAGVDFVSSAFLRLCLQGAKLAGGGAFRICRASPAVKKLFVVAGLEQLLG